jgi:hypothetical protein
VYTSLSNNLLSNKLILSQIYQNLKILLGEILNFKKATNRCSVTTSKIPLIRS